MGIRFIDRAPLYQRSEKSDITAVSTTGATNVSALGFHDLASTSTVGPVELTLAPPVKGYRAEFYCRTIGSTSSLFYLDCSSSGTTYDGTNDRLQLASSDYVSLIGLSSSRWIINNYIAATTFAASTST